jgi:hypothetical protein
MKRTSEAVGDRADAGDGERAGVKPPAAPQARRGAGEAGKPPRSLQRAIRRASWALTLRVGLLSMFGRGRRGPRGAAERHRTPPAGRSRQRTAPPADRRRPPAPARRSSPRPAATAVSGPSAEEEEAAKAGTRRGRREGEQAEDAAPMARTRRPSPPRRRIARRRSAAGRGRGRRPPPGRAAGEGLPRPARRTLAARMPTRRRRRQQDLGCRARAQISAHIFRSCRPSPCFWRKGMIPPSSRSKHHRGS